MRSITASLKRAEGNNGIEPVAEFGAEEILDRFHVLAGVVGGKADGPFVHLPRPGIGGHDQDNIAEIRLPAGIVGQRRMVHDLKQNIENIRMGLFDFIEQQYTVRVLADGVG